MVVAQCCSRCDHEHGGVGEARARWPCVEWMCGPATRVEMSLSTSAAGNSRLGGIGYISAMARIFLIVLLHIFNRQGFDGGRI